MVTIQVLLYLDRTVRRIATSASNLPLDILHDQNVLISEAIRMQSAQYSNGGRENLPVQHSCCLAARN